VLIKKQLSENAHAALANHVSTTNQGEKVMRIDPKAAPTSRRIHKRGQKKKVHLIAPGKCRGMIQAESRLEVSGAIAMALDPRVVSFRPQPITFDLATGRGYNHKADLTAQASKISTHKRIYTPDFEVTFPRGKVYIEFKHSGIIRRAPEVLMLPNILARYGHRLILIDESYLPETFVQNSRLLHIATKTRIDPEASKAILTDCEKPMLIGNLCAQGYSQNFVLALVASGGLTCDLATSRLTPKTSVIKSAHAQHLMQLPFHNV
tara:strand:+ start:2516 stop:3307 length:792 start_codon:yes stop_codon:yes gene_type:complete